MWTVNTLSVVEESAIQEGQLEVGEEVTALYMRKAHETSILCIGKFNVQLAWRITNSYKL